MTTTMTTTTTTTSAITAMNNYFVINHLLFRDFLKELKSRLESRACPNFWIQSINLFDNFKDIDYGLKLGIVNDVILNPLRYVADNYLEFARCITLKCCYCGPPGLKYLIPFYQTKNINESQCCVCCSCSYTNTPCCLGPCEYNQVAVDVY